MGLSYIQLLVTAEQSIGSIGDAENCHLVHTLICTTPPLDTNAFEPLSSTKTFGRLFILFALPDLGFLRALLCYSNLKLSNSGPKF